MTSQSANYQAKVNFYHEAVGTVVQGKTVEIQDSQVAQKLEQMGYVQKVDAQVHSQMSQAQQEVQAKQAQYGQEQAKANENAGIASHEQNVQANQATQEFQQARQQQSQTTQAQTQADQALMHDKSHEFQPSATTNADTKAQITQAKASRAKATDSHENK